MNYHKWVVHPTYTHYECNSDGIIRNKISKHIMKQCNFKGYLYVHLSIGLHHSRFISAHRFILESFTGLNKLDVNHINGDKKDNKLINLEWVTKSENCIHREEVINTGNSKKTKCIETGIIYNSTKDAHRKTGISQSNINQVALNKRKTAGKFHWIFVERGDE